MGIVVKLTDLIEVQRTVNSIIKEKLEKPVTNKEFILAFNVELFEYFNAIGIWKWWKHSHKIVKERVLDELADCFAFFLSLLDNQEQYLLESGEESIIERVENEINFLIDSLETERERMGASEEEVVSELILHIGTDNENEESVYSTERFAAAIYLATLLFPGITWEEMTEAYLTKSQENINRQERNY